MKKGLALFLCMLLMASMFIFPMPSVALDYGMDEDLSSVDASFQGEEKWDNSSTSIVIAGDINGDGYQDILIGAPDNDRGGESAGAAYLFFGKNNGWAMDTNLSNSDASFYGEHSFDHSGYSVAGAGDVNGDGYDDFLIGALNDNNGIKSGQVYLFFGKSSGWSPDTNLSSADASYVGEFKFDNLGWCVDGAGDVNGDGFDDILISTPYSGKWGNNYGRTYLIFGKENGWNRRTQIVNSNASFTGEAADTDWASEMAAGVGDVNGDGYDDIIIGASQNSDNGFWAGKAYLIFGKEKGWDYNITLSNANASFLGANTNDRLGYWVQGVGDVNGDELDDFLIKGGKYVNIVFGKTSGWEKDTDISNADASFRGEGNNAVTRGIGGDFNGDGYSDLLLGSLGNDENGNNTGQVYIVLGKQSGWKKDTNVSDAAVASFLGEGDHDRLGNSMNNGGDVNGDGYDDILVGTSCNNESGESAGQTYLIFPFQSTQPNIVSTVKLYGDQTYSTEITLAYINDRVYVELTGTDSNASRADIAIVKVTSDASSPKGFKMNLYETGASTGIFRGYFDIRHRTNAGNHRIGAMDGETIRVTPIEDPSKSATLIAKAPIMLLPTDPNTTVLEDISYNERFWTKYATATNWNFNTNASWLTWNATEHNVSGTPNNVDVGTYWIHIGVEDQAGHTDYINYSLEVINTPPQILTENEITASEDMYYEVDYDSDDEGLGGKWSLITFAYFLEINETTGVVNGTPGQHQLGEFKVNISIDDGNGGINSTEFNITVYNTNDPPTITTTDVNVTYEDDLYSKKYEAEDMDPVPTEFEWHLDTNATWLIIGRYDGWLNGTPLNGDVGDYYVNISVTDQVGGRDYHNFTLEVLNTNDPPIWENLPTDTTIKVGMIFRIDVNATDIDVADNVTYFIDSTPPSSIQMDLYTGEVEWEPDTPGTYIINITATDGELFIYHEFTIEVLQGVLNSKPVAKLASPLNNSEIEELTPTLKWTVTDEDGDPLTSDIYIDKDLDAVKALEANARPKTKVDALEYKVDIPLEKGTTYYWTIIPHDGKAYGSCENRIWTFDVKETAFVNHAPTIEAIEDRTIPVGKEFTLQVVGSDIDPEDADKLIFSIEGGPEGLVIDSSTGEMTWRPKTDQRGDHTINISLTDGKEVVSTSFNIEVKEKKTPTDGDMAELLPIIAAVIIIVVVGIVLLFVFMRRRGPTAQSVPPPQILPPQQQPPLEYPAPPEPPPQGPQV